MAKTTTNLGLYEKESTDSNDTFNIQQMLNDNWDKIDELVAKKEEIPTNIPTKTSDLTNDGDGTHAFATTNQIPLSLPAAGGDATSINDHTAAATPQTTEQIDLIKMTNEVKNLLDTHEAEFATYKADKLFLDVRGYRYNG